MDLGDWFTAMGEDVKRKRKEYVTRREKEHKREEEERIHHTALLGILDSNDIIEHLRFIEDQNAEILKLADQLSSDFNGLNSQLSYLESRVSSIEYEVNTS